MKGVYFVNRDSFECLHCRVLEQSIQKGSFVIEIKLSFKF